MSASSYTPLHDFASKLPAKPKAGLYIDDSNLYHGGKLAGWMCDYKKIYKWVASLNTVVYARLYLGIPKHEPARTISKAMKEYFEKNGFRVTSKELKRITDSHDPKGFKNKCNFDVELHDEVMEDLRDIDIVYITSGDSDFLRTKEKVLKNQKHIKFLAYESNCASEIKYTSWFESLDKIKTEISRSPKTEKPDVKSGELA
ncbi:MAG: NYN domain-containing protein [bacterium]